jgi:hypothetical protein
MRHIAAAAFPWAVASLDIRQLLLRVGMRIALSNRLLRRPRSTQGRKALLLQLIVRQTGLLRRLRDLRLVR